MPIVGFKCPVERVNVDWDHFEHCTALRGRAAYPPWLARLVAERVLNDVRHASTALTATRTLGCPRRTWIELLLDYRVDPARGCAAHRGTALHTVAADKLDPDGWYTESNDPVRLQVHGTLFKGAYEGGIELSAQVDAIRRDLTEIVDHKFPKDWSVRYRRNRNGFAGPEHSVQLNIARLLLAQQPWAIEAGYNPDTVMMTVWDHAIGDREGPEPMVVNPMDDMAILTATPWGERWTVSDIITAYLDAKATVEAAMAEGMPVEAALATVPLLGEQMMGGQMCTGYCDVAEQCAGLARQYGRPAATVRQQPGVVMRQELTRGEG